MTAKTIPVTLPLEVWGRLATIAEHQGVKVADVVALAVTHEIRDIPTDELARLSQALDAARASGWRAPRRGRQRRTA